MSKCKIRDNAKLLSWQTPSCADNNELSIQNYVSCYSFFYLTMPIQQQAGQNVHFID